MKLRSSARAAACALALVVAAAPARATDITWSLVPVMPAGGQAFAYDSNNAWALVFGGGDNLLLHNQVWFRSNISPSVPWRTLATTGTPPSPRRSALVAFDAVHRRLLVFGGLTQYTGLDDVWELTLPTGQPRQWAPIVTAGTPPPWFYGRSMVYDPVRNRLLVFGGYIGVFSNDVYALSLSGTPTWSLLAPAGTPPPARWLHGAAWDAAHDRMVVFGGAGSSYTSLNDAWALSFTPEPAWTQLSASGPTLALTPSSESTPHAVVVDPVRDRLLVTGVYLNGTAGVWAMDLSAGTWSLLPATAPAHGDWEPLAAFDAANDRVLMLGRAPLNDLWALPQAGPLAWSRLRVSDERPAPRSRHTSMLDPTTDKLWIYGGYGQWGSHIHPQAPVLGDVWNQEGGLWNRITPGGSPPSPRFGHTAIYDPVFHRMLVFGGRIGAEDGPASNEVWALLNLGGAPTWQALTSAGALPSPRFGHTAVVDGANHRMIVFGGTDGTTAFDDTWALDLSTLGWSLLTPAGAAPSPRYDASAIWDATRQRMVVFGGWAGGDPATAKNDVHVLDLSGPPAWVAVTPPGDPPPPHYGHSAVLDGAYDRMLVFGGDETSDVWSLPLGSGAAWQTLAASPDAPRPRRYAGAVKRLLPDSITLVLGQTPCYGPDCWRSWNALGDTWRGALRGPVSAPGPSAGPLDLSLGAPWPSPARGAASVTLVLPRADRATLAMFDVSGRRVMARDLGSLGAGRHVIALPEVAQLEPGVYLVRLTQAGLARSTRLCVMR